MDEIAATYRAHCLCSSLLQALVLVVLVFPSSVAAHVGVHEEIERLTRLIQQDSTNPQLYVWRGEVRHIACMVTRAVLLRISTRRLVSTQAMSQPQPVWAGHFWIRKTISRPSFT